MKTNYNLTVWSVLIDLIAQQISKNRRLLAIVEIVSLAAIISINKLP